MFLLYAIYVGFYIFGIICGLFSGFSLQSFFSPKKGHDETKKKAQRESDKDVTTLWEKKRLRIMYYQHDHDVLKEATDVGKVFDGDVTSFYGGCNYEIKYNALLSYDIIKMTLVVYLLLCVSDEGMGLSLSGQIRGYNPNAFGFFSPKNSEGGHGITICDYLSFCDVIMTMKTRKIIASVLVLSMITMFGLNTANAQYSSDQGDTKLNIVSEGGELLVNTFDIDFGNVASSATDRLVTGTIVGNQGYIITKDTLANKIWYVTIDATDMIGSGSSGTGAKVIKDSKLVMTAVGGTSAITVLSGNATTEIRGVAQTGVNFSGSNGYTIMERTAFTSGITGRYGIIPTFRLTIPGYTPVGSYLGSIEVSLYTP